MNMEKILDLMTKYDEISNEVGRITVSFNADGTGSFQTTCTNRIFCFTGLYNAEAVIKEAIEEAL